MRRSRNARSAIAIALAALLAAGCAPTPPALPAGVELEIVQQRSDVADRAVQVRVVNGSDAELVVTRVELLDARFEPPIARERVSPVQAGHAVDLRVVLPAAVCGAPSAAGVAPRVRLEVEGLGSVTAPAADVLGVLGPLHVGDCLAGEVSDVAAIEVDGFETGPAGEAGVLAIGVRPVAGSADAAGPALVLVELRGTNLLRSPMGADGAHVLGVPVRIGDAPSRLEVPLLPARCDPHAVLEDKRGTVFTLTVRVGDVEGPITLVAPEPIRQRVLDWVLDWCEALSG